MEAGVHLFSQMARTEITPRDNPFRGGFCLLLLLIACIIIEPTACSGRHIDPIIKELYMTHSTTEPRMTSAGVSFTVRVDSVNRDCFISNEALAKLCQLKGGDNDLMETFRAFEATINGVARRLVAANVRGTPLQLGPDSFH